METWKEIQKTIDYIEEHLDQALRIQPLAELAHLSPFYYQRLFARLVKRPVMDYIKMRRLAHACQDLLNSNERILDIALKNGFSSHAHFARVFKAAFAITPELYRKERPALNQVLKPNLSMQYVLIDEGVPLITNEMFLEISYDTLVKEETYLGILGKMSIGANIPIGAATGINQADQLWQSFYTLKPSIPHLLDKGSTIGVSFLKDSSLDPEKLGSDQSFDYFVGMQSDGTPSEAWEEWRIPAGEYIICRFETEKSEPERSTAIAKALSYLLSTWMPKKMLISEPYSIEKYQPSADADVEKIEIWVAPLQKNELENP
ncbi:AraC family transcriptional regulator [Enterococcus florum]|nr:AraC family transcriptional regulator [Enterococcus florum]